jgi:RNAse (barnase) inhibitor barstar
MGALENAGNQASATAALARSVLRELTDGVHIKLVRVGKDTMWDFVTGKVKELPFEIQVDLLEDDDK